jgi:uncharacterized protein VirK/YbjX
LTEARKLKAGEFARLAGRLSSLTRDEAVAPLLLRHVDVVRRLTTSPTAALARRDPSLTRKYVAPYLAQSLNHVERRRILLFHNDYLAHSLNERFFEEAASPQRPTWSSGEAQSQAVWVKANDLLGGEGDLTLAFTAGGLPLYELSFSLAPTSEQSASAAMLIVRIQGARGRFAEIRQATADCGDIAPAHVLVSAAEGVAVALGVSTILGIGNDEQLSKASVDKAGCLFDYDVFWESLGGRPRRGWFQFDAPYAGKPLSQTPTTHRRRTRRKRRAKAALRDEVTTAFLARYVGAS